MANTKLQVLVLSDFDGTLTYKDSFKEFIRFFFHRRRPRINAVLALPAYLFWKLGFLEADRAKEQIWLALFGGYDEETLVETGEAFVKIKLPGLFRPGAEEALIQYRKEGAVVCIVTASSKYWIAPWCRTQGFELIATEYETAEGKITGRYCGANCRGPEKVTRISSRYQLKDFGTIIAFGDTPDDLPMLALAHHPHYGFFEKGVTGGLPI